MIVDVQSLRGWKLKMEGFTMDSKVEDVMNKIQERLGVPSQFLELACKGKICSNNQTLESLQWSSNNYFVIIPLSTPSKSSSVRVKRRSSNSSEHSFKRFFVENFFPIESSRSIPVFPVPLSTPIPILVPREPRIVPVVVSERSLEFLKNMGFPEEQCRSALISAQNNIDRATEILLQKGISDHLERDQVSDAEDNDFEHVSEEDEDDEEESNENDE